MRIYMDAYCYNRPMDDQNQDRIFIESEAIKAILLRCEQDCLWSLVGSDVLKFELNNNPNPEKKQRSFALYNCTSEKHYLTNEIKKRAVEFEKSGTNSLDSLHLAMAESIAVDVLLTVNDGFIKSANRADANVKVENPVNWLMEVLQYE